MNSWIRIGVWVGLGLAFSACAASDRYATEPGRKQPAVQFADIPVPDGMQLNEGQSHSMQVGEFRHGDFHYRGNMAIADVASYMTRRMSLHGWEVADAGATDPEANRVDLDFRRRPDKATCEIWHDGTATFMKIAVRTEVPK